MFRVGWERDRPGLSRSRALCDVCFNNFTSVYTLLELSLVPIYQRSSVFVRCENSAIRPPLKLYQNWSAQINKVHFYKKKEEGKEAETAGVNNKISAQEWKTSSNSPIILQNVSVKVNRNIQTTDKYTRHRISLLFLKDVGHWKYHCHMEIEAYMKNVLILKIYGTPDCTAILYYEHMTSITARHVRVNHCQSSLLCYLPRFTLLPW